MAEEDHAGLEIPENGQRKIRGSVLDQFRHISNDNEARRLKNAVLLLKHLCISENDNNEIKYALDRLIRGLGSSRNSARVGFYSTLVALLNTYSLNIEQVFGSIQKQLQIGSSYSKSETGDIYTGQILACGALIRSGMFLKGSIEEQKSILEQLLNAGKMRSYLALAASSFIVDLLNSLDEKQFEKQVWPTLKQEILKPWPEQTLDSIYLLILVQKKFPQLLKPQTIKKCFGTREIFSEENITPVVDILMNIAAVRSLKHSAYELISKEVAASDIIPSFVAHLDSQLLGLNRNKLLAVSLIIRNMIPNLKDQSQIPLLLTPNFVAVMLQYYRNHHSYNHDEDFQAGMTKFFESLVNSLKQEEVETKTKIAVLKSLLLYPGSFMIENITKSRILQQLVQTLDLDGIKKLSKLYKEVLIAKKEKVVGENITEPWLNAERIYAAQLLVKLLSNPKVQNEVEWKLEYLKLFINMSIVQHHKYTNVGAELGSALREVFFRALDQRFSKLEDMRNLLSELTNHFESLISPDNYEEVLRVSLTEEEFEILQQMFKTVKSFETVDDKNKYTLVFQILFLQMGLQLFKDKELATSSLKELFLCYERVKNEKKQTGDDNDEASDLEWIEVVIDLFLNLLSHSSHLLRNVICSVFPYLCKYITPSSMHQILSVLDPKSEVNPLSIVDESDSDSDSDESDEENEEENESEGSEASSESEVDERETVTDQLRMAVSQALGNDGHQTDEESLDLDDMSDSEGRRLDEALAQAFKEFKPNKGRNNKKQTKNDETLTHFRTRVLDLLEIYLDSEPAMLSCLEIMLPLLQTLEFTIRDEHQKPLQARVKSCLKKLTNLKKFSTFEGITETILGDLFDSLLGKGTKSAMMIQDMSSEISECCVFLIKCSQIICAGQTPKKTKRKLKEKLLVVLSDAVSVYFNQRDCLIPYPLFKSTFQLNWEGNLTLVPIVFEFTFNVTTRPFRRSQALELLKLFYLNRRLQINAETFKMHVGEHEKQFCNKVIEMIDDFCENPTKVKIKERFIYHVFNLLKAMVSHPLKNEDIDWKVIGEKIREYRSYVTLSKDAKTAFNQLCAKLNIPNIVKMKSQVIKLSKDQEDDCDDLNQPPEKSKQKNKGNGGQNSKKLKKEARTLRFESMSQGFSNFSFSNVDITHVKSDEVHTNGISDAESEGSSPSEDVNTSKEYKIKNKKARKRLSSENDKQNHDSSSHKKKKHK